MTWTDWPSLRPRAGDEVTTRVPPEKRLKRHRESEPANVARSTAMGRCRKMLLIRGTHPVRSDRRHISVKSVVLPLRQGLQMRLSARTAATRCLLRLGNQACRQSAVVLTHAKSRLAAQYQRLLIADFRCRFLGFHPPRSRGLTAIVATGIHAVVMADKGT